MKKKKRIIRKKDEYKIKKIKPDKKFNKFYTKMLITKFNWNQKTRTEKNGFRKKNINNLLCQK